MHPFFHTLHDAYQSRGTIDPATPLPETSEEVVGIQFAWNDAYGGVAGWKVSPWSDTPAMWSAPIPRQWIYFTGDAFPHQKDLRVELEFALVLKRDIPDAESVTADAVDAAIAFELIRSRLPATRIWPDSIRRADLVSSLGLVIGARRPFPAGAARDVRMELSRAGMAETIVTTRLDPNALLKALEWLAAHAAATGRPLRAGTIVITGARIGPIDLPAGHTRGTADGLVPVTAEIIG